MLFVIFSFAAFNILSLSLIISLITMYLGVFLLGFILPGTLCFLDWLTISIPVLGKFSAIVSSNTFAGPFFLSSPSWTRVMQMLMCLMSSRRSHRLFSFICLFFNISFCSSDFYRFVLQVIYPFSCFSYSASGLSLFVCFLALLDAWRTFLASSPLFS